MKRFGSRAFRPWLTKRRRRSERGYVALLVAALAVPLFAMAAFAVDVGQWYVTAREAQRAADAAALGGVPYLPGDMDKAFAAAKALASDNGFPLDDSDVDVQTALDKSPTQLKVTVSKKVPSVFGQLLGVTGNTITRSAVADYAGPVPLGSPCNVYGNAPDSAGLISDVCDDVGEFWGNIGSALADKTKGDAYQNNECGNNEDGDVVHGCRTVNGPNDDHDPNGYFYAVTLTAPVSNLVIEAFDPALIHVKDHCDWSSLDGEAGTRYAKGKDSPYCTGDVDFSSSTEYDGMVQTTYTVRDPGPNAWDPLSFPARNDCSATTYRGYKGELSTEAIRSDDYLKSVFRQWVPLCQISSAPEGTYLVQIQTNVEGADRANGHNRFSLRAYSASDPTAKDHIAISGLNKMSMYANKLGATTGFYLARVPSGAAGQILNVSLYDVGDSTNSGTIKILPPSDPKGSFSDCIGKGAIVGALPDCTLYNVAKKTSAETVGLSGKWQVVQVPIPTDYACDDEDPNECWVRLQYDYGSGNQPTDTTSWAASIEGDPVRLIE